jgi:tetratricopeptide (TPR) repeat protein
MKKPFLLLVSLLLLAVGSAAQNTSGKRLPETSSPELQAAGSFPPEPQPLRMSPPIEGALESAAKLNGQREFELALEVVNRALFVDAQAAIPDKFGRAMLLQQKGANLSVLGSSLLDDSSSGDTPLAVWRQAMRLFGEVGAAPEQVSTLSLMATYLVDKGDPSQAEGAYKEALEIAAKPTNRPAAMGASLSGGASSLLRHRPKWSEQLWKAALALCRRYASGSWEMAATLDNLGWEHLNAGELNASDALFREAIAMRDSWRDELVDLQKKMNQRGTSAEQHQDVLRGQVAQNQTGDYERQLSYVAQNRCC